MTWQDRLELLLRDRNKAAVARACGWDDFRVSQIVGRGSVPNAIDAIILCDYLGVSVEAIFGDDAAKALGKPLRSVKHKAATPEEAAEQALSEAVAKHRGKGRKTG